VPYFCHELGSGDALFFSALFFSNSRDVLTRSDVISYTRHFVFLWKMRVYKTNRMQHWNCWAVRWWTALCELVVTHSSIVNSLRAYCWHLLHIVVTSHLLLYGPLVTVLPCAACNIAKCRLGDSDINVEGSYNEEIIVR